MKYLVDHPLTNCVLWAFHAATQKRGEFACPYETELGSVDVAQYLMGTYQARELMPGEQKPADNSESGRESLISVYEPVARDAMSVMLNVGILEKSSPGKLRKGDTFCRVSKNVDFGQSPREDVELDRGLSNDWISAGQEVEALLCDAGGLFDRFTANAVLAGLNYILVNQTWKQRHMPEDMRHGFLECDLYFPLCEYLEGMSERIEPFEIYPKPEGL